MFDKLEAGQRIRVAQTIVRREGDWRGDVSGVIVEVTHASTGAWYAHGRDNKYWLRRVTIKKDDGELTTLTLDQNTEIEILADAEPNG